MKKIERCEKKFKGMKKNFKVWNCFWGYEKVPFGYEKKLTFENFPFHTLGYENIGCFVLMIGSQFSNLYTAVDAVFEIVRDNDIARERVLFIGTQFSILYTSM